MPLVEKLSKQWLECRRIERAVSCHPDFLKVYSLQFKSVKNSIIGSELCDFLLVAPPVINYYNGFEIAVIAGLSEVPRAIDPCLSKEQGYKNIHAL